MVAIAGFRDHVNAQLGERARLEDPKKLLAGTGKSIRHVKIRSVADARDPEVRKLVEQELATGTKRLKGDPRARERALQKIRSICLRFAETSERPSHGAPTFFFRGKKAFAMILTDFHEDGRFAISCAAPSGAQRALVKAAPDRFFVPPYVGHRGWLGVSLDRRPNWGEIEAILGDAYREVASPRRGT